MIPYKFDHQKLYFLDQRRLPHDEVWLEQDKMNDILNSIKDMVVRGAPLIGFSGLFALAYYFKENERISLDQIQSVKELIKSARPTAVNLMFEIDRIWPEIEKRVKVGASSQQLYSFVLEDCFVQMRELENRTRAMAHFALDDLKYQYGHKKLKILTHCNTGELACGTLGTALGCIFVAHQNQLVDKVWVDETRPYLQGSRLTAYELMKENIPHEVVVEGAAHYLMSNGWVDAIFVGADRIAANGDTANKIGTANLALIAHYYKIPFYVVAPLSTFDFKTSSGKEIHIELRNPEEILSFANTRVAPHQSHAFNPSFDITPGQIIHGIICEKGLIKQPNREKLKVWSY